MFNLIVFSVAYLGTDFYMTNTDISVFLIIPLFLPNMGLKETHLKRTYAEMKLLQS